MDLCGTTASVALVSPDGCHAVVCNIGDSRTGLVGEWATVAQLWSWKGLGFRVSGLGFRVGNLLALFGEILIPAESQRLALLVFLGYWTSEVEHTGFNPEIRGETTMTHAHRVSDPAEMARIDRAGGFVEYGASGHRVNGVLGVSRAIGYCGMKDFADLVPSLSDSVILERDGTKAGRLC